LQESLPLTHVVRYLQSNPWEIENMLQSSMHSTPTRLSVTAVSGANAFSSWCTVKCQENAQRINAALRSRDSRGEMFHPSEPISSDQAPLIVVVDDEPVVAVTLSEILRRHCFNAVWFIEPNTALLFIEKAAIDLLISDITMPMLDGITVTDPARQWTSACGSPSGDRLSVCNDETSGPV
jgi:Response regulator receiver domain